MTELAVPTLSYRQFDADLAASVPAEGYGGWHKLSLPLDLEHTAIVVMHAWDCGTAQEYPGWFRAVEYIPRSYAIARTVFPRLLGAARNGGMTVLHVVGGHDYYSHRSGYAGGAADPWPEASLTARSDAVYDKLVAFRADNVFPGASNQADVAAGGAKIDFLPDAAPRDGEGIAATSTDLLRLCGARGINHLIYAGFAIDGCLLTSPGGMVDLSRHGFLCSAVRDGVTAIENGDTARTETAKQLALWRVALHFGFVYEADDLVGALQAPR